MSLKDNLGYIIIVLIVVLYLLFTVYLKRKLKFWITQPVFHIYNLWHWIKPVGVIESDKPSISSIAQKGASKHLNQYNIKTIDIDNLKDTVLCDKICHFIKTNYIFQACVQAHTSMYAPSYTPSKSNIMEYYYGTNHPSFFSIYEQPKILFEKGEAAHTIKELIGVISARALTITLKNQPPFPTYYIDNLCVDPLHRKRGIAPQLIQTQCYNLRHANKKIQTCLFKREGQLNALVPLVVFDTYCFNLTNIKVDMANELKEVSIIEIGIPQLPLFIDFIQSQKPYYECIVLPDIANLINLLKSENLIIYAVMNRQGQLLASFIFRLLNLSYDGKRAVECINVIVLKDINNNLYINSILNKLRKKSHFDYVLIEDTANAGVVIDHLINNIKAPIFFKSPTAFFMYNYACHSISKASLGLFIY